MELAIDTSTNFAGIALSDNGMILCEIMWHSNQNHTVELVPYLEDVLAKRDIEIKAVNAIFVAKGPGSYNGLRVGISTAKGFAYALEIPIVAVSTMEIEAYPFSYLELPICPVHVAGRGEIAVAFYQKDRYWKCLEEEHLTSLDILCDRIKSKTIFCGEISEMISEQLQKRLKDLAIIPDMVTRLRRPSYLACLGWEKLNMGIRDEPHTLQPTYLRQPPITISKTKIIKK